MISKIYVPNEGPDGAEIVLVGESPGAEEVRLKRPFIGPSGDKLTEVITKLGVYREEVKLANLCHYRPEGNDFSTLLDTPQLEEGIKELHEYLLMHKPKIIVTLGNYPTFFLTGKGKRKKVTGKQIVTGIYSHRSSILPCILPGLDDVKVVPTFHPSYVLRDRSIYPIFKFDMEKAFKEKDIKGFNYPERNFIINPKGMDLWEWTEKLSQAEYLAVDIETVIDSTYILCVGFAIDNKTCVVLVNDGTVDYMNSLHKILSSKAKKIFHFGSFDSEQLRLNGFVTQNYAFDTLTAQHALNPEFPRSLAFLTSLYSRQPYYKSEGRDSIPGDQKAWSKKSEKEKLYTYNATDCCETFNAFMEQTKELEEAPRQKKTFNFEMSLLPVALKMSENGMLIDQERRKLLDKAIRTRWGNIQVMLDILVGEGKYFNVSGMQVRKLLFEKFGLPVRKKRGKITTDEDALVSLIAVCEEKIRSLTDGGKGQADWKFKQTILKAIIEVRGLRKLVSTYTNIKISQDGRLRSTWIVSGPETGRWACAGYVDGTGINQQTFPRTSFLVE